MTGRPVAHSSPPLAQYPSSALLLLSLSPIAVEHILCCPAALFQRLFVVLYMFSAKCFAFETKKVPASDHCNEVDWTDDLLVKASDR